jgi:hypothetical protein
MQSSGDSNSVKKSTRDIDPQKYAGFKAPGGHQQCAGFNFREDDFEWQ